MEPQHHASILALLFVVAGAPLAAFALVGLPMVLGVKLPEWPVARVVRGSIAASGLALAGATALWLRAGHPPVVLDAGALFRVADYEFAIGFVVDHLSVVMAWLVVFLAGLIARFSETYLHREPGFARFFALLALFAGAMLVLVLASTYDMLFIGWELVGLASAFLIAFFHHRAGPVRSALRVFVTYRVADVGLLLAAAGMHHHLGVDHVLLANDPANATLSAIDPTARALIAVGLVIGAMGKSAQLPLSGWLPRAMEGPTPSSAIFYGGLAVHAGIYLLIRSWPILAHAPVARGLIIATGLLTFAYASQVVQVQVDAKGTLAHATMAQLGLLFVEVGCGLTTVALVHLVGHALLRTWQLLKAPSTFQDAARTYSALAAGGAPVPAMSHAPRSPRRYHVALGRFAIETVTEKWVLWPLIVAGNAIERFERRLEALIAGAPGPDESLPQDDASATVSVTPGLGEPATARASVTGAATTTTTAATTAATTETTTTTAAAATTTTAAATTTATATR